MKKILIVPILLLGILVLVGAGCGGGEKEAEEGTVPPGGEEVGESVGKEPLWQYSTNGWIACGGLKDGGISMSLDGNYIAVGVSDAMGPDNVLLFKKDSSTPLWNYQIDDLEVQSVSISSDGNYIAVATFGASDGKLYFFQKDSSTPLWTKNLRPLPFADEPTDWVPLYSVSVSAQGDYIAVGMWNYGELLLVSKDGQILWSRELADFNLSRVLVSISSDGNYVAAACPSLVSQQKIYLFEKDAEIIAQRPDFVPVAAPVWSYETEGAENFDLYSISISSDGNYIAVGSSNRVYLFKRDSGTPLWTYDLECDDCSVSLSSDGGYLAVAAFRYGSGANTSTVYLFKKDSNTPLWSHTSDTNTGAAIRSVAISSDGEYIAAAGESGCYLFHQDDNVPLWEYFPLLRFDMGHACISSDGNYMVAGGKNGGGILFFDKTVPEE